MFSGDRVLDWHASEAVISVGALELFPGETMTEGILEAV